MLNGFLMLIAACGVVFILLCAAAYLRQDRMIFVPGPNDPGLLSAQQPNRVEIQTSGATLEGWWVENPQATTSATILYFGGNAEDVLSTAMTAPRFNARAMLFVNYRGYGHSTGNSGQRALFEDGLAVYSYAIGKGAQARNIVVMGRSLGSGVASMLAGAREVRGAILVTPYDTLASVAAEHYPFLPIRLLLRHPFPSVEWAKQAHSPALILAAGQDVVIPAAHAQKLFESWAGKKQVRVLAPCGHNDIDENPGYYRLINEFLQTETSS